MMYPSKPKSFRSIIQKSDKVFIKPNDHQPFKLEEVCYQVVKGKDKEENPHWSQRSSIKNDALLLNSQIVVIYLDIPSTHCLKNSRDLYTNKVDIQVQIYSMLS